MLSTDLLPWFDALPPFFGGTPCRLFYCLQEEGEWVEKTRVQTSGSGRHPEVFFCAWVGEIWGPSLA